MVLKFSISLLCPCHHLLITQLPSGPQHVWSRGLSDFCFWYLLMSMEEASCVVGIVLLFLKTANQCNVTISYLKVPSVRTHIQSWWGYKLMKPFWKLAGHFILKLKMCLPHFSSGWWKYCKIVRRDSCMTLNKLKTIPLHTLNVWMTWRVNYISINLLQIKKIHLAKNY